MATRADGPGVLQALLPRQLGLVGQVATSWGVAGGLIAALVVTAHVFAGNLSSSVSFVTTSLFFLVGSVIGFLHGALLAYLGRPAEVSRARALKRLALAVLYDVPAVLAGWLVAMVLALSASSLMAGRAVTFAVTGVGWLAAALLLWWAFEETADALRNLLRRWPDARAVFVVLGLAFVALLPAFLLTRPEIWVVGVKPSATAAGAMALAATIWIAGPLTVFGLLALRAWHRHHPPHHSEAPHGGR